MKRYMALLACLFALTACGNQSDADNASADAEASNGNDSAASAESGDQTNGQASDQAGDFDSDKARRSYALGMDIGNSLKELPVDIQVDELSQGVSDVVSGKETRLSQDELDSVMQSFVKEMEAAQQQKASQQAQNNLEKGEKFLAENKDKEGVKTTDSGLQYKVLEEGDDVSPESLNRSHRVLRDDGCQLLAL